MREDQEPFSRLDVARQAKRTEQQTARQPFALADVPKLVAAAVGRDDGELTDLVRLRHVDRMPDRGAVRA